MTNDGKLLAVRGTAVPTKAVLQMVWDVEAWQIEGVPQSDGSEWTFMFKPAPGTWDASRAIISAGMGYTVTEETKVVQGYRASTTPDAGPLSTPPESEMNSMSQMNMGTDFTINAENRTYADVFDALAEWIGRPVDLPESLAKAGFTGSVTIPYNDPEGMRKAIRESMHVELKEASFERTVYRAEPIPAEELEAYPGW